MGRPSKGHRKTFLLPLTPAERDELHRLATDEHMTVSDFVSDNIAIQLGRADLALRLTQPHRLDAPTLRPFTGEFVTVRIPEPVARIAQSTAAKQSISARGYVTALCRNLLTNHAGRPEPAAWQLALTGGLAMS